MGKCKAISTPMVQLKITHKPGNSSVRTIQAKKHHCWWLGALEHFFMKTGGVTPFWHYCWWLGALEQCKGKEKNN
jgi:hypothetical protein